MDQIPPILVSACEAILESPIITCSTLSGGDINEARLLGTENELIFLKFNDAPFAKNMFEVEAKGLQILANTQTLKTPKLIAFGKANHFGYLLLEYIPSENNITNFWSDFGIGLAKLHQTTAPLFGLEHDNYIGRLAQHNNQHPSWNEFYTLERLQPQVKMAIDNGLLNTNLILLFDSLYKNINSICPEEKPALIHGDLWSGNFIVSKNVGTVLIDPAISYSHREMDLAMSLLFGGFSKEFYNSYQTEFPLAKGFDNRVEIYQLYYLLVHLNLFGRAYKNSVKRILKRFS